MAQDVHEDGWHVLQVAAGLQLEGSQKERRCSFLQEAPEQLRPCRWPQAGWQLWRLPHCLQRVSATTDFRFTCMMLGAGKGGGETIR